MKYKIAVCKIHMIGSPALVLGFCRYDEDDEFWEKFQLFTNEDIINNPAQMALFQFKEGWVEKMKKKYHGKSIHFELIDKVVDIHQEGHDFNFANAKPLELSKDEWITLVPELSSDGWEDFDSETWGK